MTANQIPCQHAIERGRAGHAWDVVSNVGTEQQKKYGTLARKLPTMIQTNGLGQTAAFLSAKGKNEPDDAHTLLLSHLSEWIGPKVGGYGEYSDLLDWIIHTTAPHYRRASTEAIAFSVWLRRFVEAKNWGDVGGDVT